MNTETTDLWVVFNPKFNKIAIPMELFSQLRKHMRLLKSDYNMSKDEMTYTVVSENPKLEVATAEMMTAAEVRGRVVEATE